MKAKSDKQRDLCTLKSAFGDTCCSQPIKPLLKLALVCTFACPRHYAYTILTSIRVAGILSELLKLIVL